MTTVYLYILGASHDADRVTGVPWCVDEQEIFFGPCKKGIRQALRRKILRPEVDRAPAQEEIWIAGFNATPTKGPRVRKLLWAGRITEGMSFGRAWLDLKGPRYQKMREYEKGSPLNVEPIDGEGCPRGYRFREGGEHKEGSGWLDDVLTPAAKRRASESGFVSENEVLLPHSVSWWEGFPRDFCMLLENHYFANLHNAGLAIDDDLLKILRDGQPERTGIDQFAIFGQQRSGTVDGRKGGALVLKGDLASRFVEWLGQTSPQSAIWSPQVGAIGAERSGG